MVSVDHRSDGISTLLKTDDPAEFPVGFFGGLVVNVGMAEPEREINSDLALFIQNLPMKTKSETSIKQRIPSEPGVPECSAVEEQAEVYS